jgi:Ca-activated chloride channel family protein
MAGVAAMLVAACTPGPPPDQSTDAGPGYVEDAKTINIVAGSEQEAVLEQIVKPWCQAHQYTCNTEQKGSVDQARLLASGTSDFDAYWFASSVFEQVGNDGTRLQDVEPMFLTPTVFAGRKSEMQRLGFVGRTDVTIAEVLRAVESGQTKVWITNPTQSNSGATAYLALLNHLAGNPAGQALTTAQLELPAVTDGITRFVRAVDRTPPSTGTLMTECVERPDDCRTVFTYEDLVAEYNQELVGRGQEPFYAVYPKDALAISDAPLGFHPKGNQLDADKRRIVKELQDYLLNDPDAQAKLLRLGRRPAAKSFGLNLTGADPAVFNADWGLRPVVTGQEAKPPAAAVIEAALDRYQTAFRRPAQAWFCLDGSGSMVENDGWAGVQAAGHQLFDVEQARANFLLTHPGDRTTVAIFNQDIAGGPWTVEGNDPSQLHGLAERIDGYRADGGTDMYACLKRAADDLTTRGDERKQLVVVLSDGKSDQGGRQEATTALQRAGVPVVAIAFGDDVDRTQLEQIAKDTEGSFFEQSNLVTALQQATSWR